MCYIPHFKTEPLMTCSIYQEFLSFLLGVMSKTYLKRFITGMICLLLKFCIGLLCYLKITQIYFILRFLTLFFHRNNYTFKHVKYTYRIWHYACTYCITSFLFVLIFFFKQLKSFITK